MIIAIDGPAASGKGTIARRLAAHYGLPHLDTGLLYRATAAALIAPRIATSTTRKRRSPPPAASDLWISTRTLLRSRQMGEAASVVAAMPGVRQALLDAQRTFAARPEGAVLDGRDIGTVVCPHATVKFFVTASAAARAQRRALELSQRGEKADYAAILADIQKRDALNSARATAPLRPANDAVRIDTTHLGIEAAVAGALHFVEAARVGTSGPQARLQRAVDRGVPELSANDPRLIASDDTDLVDAAIVASIALAPRLVQPAILMGAQPTQAHSV